MKTKCIAVICVFLFWFLGCSDSITNPLMDEPVRIESVETINEESTIEWESNENEENEGATLYSGGGENG